MDGAGVDAGAGRPCDDAIDAGALPCRSYTALGTQTRPRAWALWLDAHLKTLRPRITQLHDHHFLMIEAAWVFSALRLPEAMVGNDLAKGRLVAPRGFEPDGTSYGLLRPMSQPVTEAVETLSAWLQRTARSDAF